MLDGSAPTALTAARPRRAAQYLAHESDEGRDLKDLAEHVLDSGPRPGRIFELAGDVGVAQSPPRTELDDYAEPREMALHGAKRIAPRWQGCTGSLVEGNGWQGPWEAPQLLWAWASGP